MSSDVLESKWQKLKDEIRSQWGKLTDDDIERIAGNKDKLIGVVQERYGYVWDEARQMVDRYLDDYNGLKTQATDALRAVASSENLHKFKTDVVDLVRRHPIPALLVGLGIGYLIARRTKDKLCRGSRESRNRVAIARSWYRRRCQTTGSRPVRAPQIPTAKIAKAKVVAIWTGIGIALAGIARF
jgi:uncharacterized protein YjbJ (UPF0337 family)